MDMMIYLVSDAEVPVILQGLGNVLNGESGGRCAITATRKMWMLEKAEPIMDVGNALANLLT